MSNVGWAYAHSCDRRMVLRPLRIYDASYHVIRAENHALQYLPSILVISAQIVSYELPKPWALFSTLAITSSKSANSILA